MICEIHGEIDHDTLCPYCINSLPGGSNDEQAVLDARVDELNASRFAFIDFLLNDQTIHASAEAALDAAIKATE